jgi:hypothetical protein
MRRMMGSRRRAAPDSPVPPVRQEDFAHDEGRWAFEILLAEFRALRAEIVTVKTQLERTYAYLFALIGAILASQLLDVTAPAFLEEHVWIVATAALIAMWFPINHQLMSTDMILAGTYIRDVLAPKLNFLAYNSVRRQCSDGEIDARLGWSDQMKGNLQGWIYVEMSRRPMSWEQFMAYMRLGDKRRGWIFLPLYVTRGLILYVPTLALLIMYVALQIERRTAFIITTREVGDNFVEIRHHLGIEWPSTFLFVLVLALIVWSALGQLRTTNMLAHGTRPDGHTEIPET